MDISELQEFFSSFCLGPNSIITLNFVDTRESGFEPDGQISGLDSLRREFMENLRTGVMNQEGTDTKYRIQRLLFERDLLFLHRRHELYAVCEQCGHVGLPEKYFASSSCVMGTRRTFVNTDGELWPCERIRQTPFLKIGDLENGLNIPTIRQILAGWVDLTKEECQDCWCLHGCQVGCLASLSLGEKPTREEKLAACERYRRKSHEKLVEYCSLLEENPHALDYMEGITIS
jgi:radical SAM protein with 4Fe4S-binding SPASM domain